jgi:hypothetical protein
LPEPDGRERGETEQEQTGRNRHPQPLPTLAEEAIRVARAVLLRKEYDAEMKMFGIC